MSAKRAPLLKLMAELASFEKAMATERLLAKAEVAELRRLRPGAQKERVILSRFCRSSAFLDALLDALRAPRSKEESEPLANLALLAAQGIVPAEGSEAFKNDLLATIWTETANTRRMRGEWQSAQTALLRAEEHGALGTGEESIKARRLSITGSLQCDQGRRADAMASLEECRKAYASCGEWPQVGRTLVTMAHCIADDESERALSLLDRAYPYIPPEDAGLRSAGIGATRSARAPFPGLGRRGRPLKRLALPRGARLYRTGDLVRLLPPEIWSSWGAWTIR